MINGYVGVIHTGNLCEPKKNWNTNNSDCRDFLGQFFLILPDCSVVIFFFFFFGPCDYSGALIYWCCEWELTMHNVGE